MESPAKYADPNPAFSPPKANIPKDAMLKIDKLVFGFYSITIAVLFKLSFLSKSLS